MGGPLLHLRRRLFPERPGQSGSAGSGQSAAQMTARQAANGRRAHQMCNVEMWPCRMDFSRRACAEMRLIGRSTSMRRLGNHCMMGMI